mgnify:CR=1 FL=1
MSRVIDNFLRYVRVDTQSADEMEQVPSTPKQKVLAAMLAEELRGMGVTDAFTDEHGYVYGTLPATPGLEALPVLGFIAHMDTSPAVSGKDVKPRIVEHYDGGDIPLGGDWVLSPAVFPELGDYVGMDLIVTDGSTLLGADDKAGVAEIMAMVQVLTENPDIPHGTLKIGFTPDEEVGRGADHFDVEGFGAAVAIELIGREIWKDAGVFSPEYFDPIPFLQIMDESGFEYGIVEMDSEYKTVNDKIIMAQIFKEAARTQKEKKNT